MAEQTISSTLSSWAGPYVERLLQQGEAFANLPYTSYDRPLSAGFTGPQTTALSGIGALTVPTSPQTAMSNLQASAAGVGSGYTAGTFGNQFNAPTAFTPGNFTSGFTSPTAYQGTNVQSNYQAPGDLYKANAVTSNYQAPAAYQAGTFTPERATAEKFGQAQAQEYMSPYTEGVIDPQLREARRQADITRMQNAARMAKAGSFGGSRQAIQEAELNRNLATQLGDIYGVGQQKAFENAQAQFERDQARRTAAQQLNIQKGLEAQQLGEQSRQFGAGLGARSAELAAQLGLQAQTATELARQAAGQQSLSSAQTAGQLGLEAAKAREQAQQFGAQQGMTAAQQAAQFGLDAQRAAEASRQFGATQAMTAAQQAAQYGLSGLTLGEQAKQQQAQLGLSALDRQLAANRALADIGLQGQAGDISRLQAMYGMGAQEQATRQAAIDRDKAEFEREQYKYPMEMLNLRKGILQGLPIATSKYYEQSPSTMQNAAALAGIAANLKNAGFDISSLFSGVDLTNFGSGGGGLGSISFGDPDQGPN